MLKPTLCFTEPNYAVPLTLLLCFPIHSPVNVPCAEPNTNSQRLLFLGNQ